jgi:hypothetical protein
MERNALIADCELAFVGVRDAKGLNSVIIALARVEEVLAALILSSEPDDTETRATLLRLADFRNLSRSMRRIS